MNEWPNRIAAASLSAVFQYCDYPSIHDNYREHALKTLQEGF